MPNNNFNQYKNQINKELENFLLKKINEIDNPTLKAHYIKIKGFVLREGKRLRPLITLMSYKAIKGEIPNWIFLPAISPEFLHAGTLIHDDIMDEDALRRNAPSMHKVMQDVFINEYDADSSYGEIFKESSTRYGVSMAILHGNILFSLGLDCILSANIKSNLKQEIAKRYNSAYMVLNDGQILDINFAILQDIEESDYVEMVMKKTAQVFSYSAELGLLLANGNKIQKEIIREIIKSIAIAFQINDDIIDLTNPSLKGHSLGSDIKKGNMTLPIIYALKKADKIKDVLGRNEISDDGIKNAIDIIKNTGAISASEEFAKKKIRIAKNLLDKNKSKFRDLEFFYWFLNS